MPATQLTDKEIDDLIKSPKPLYSDYRRRLKPRVRPYSEKHEEAQIEIKVVNTGTFRIIVRKSRINHLDFSAILGYVPLERIRLFRLRRYNGSHKHKNKIEGNNIHGFHIHYATQRYQEVGWDIDSYAQSTDRYSNFDEALETLIDDCNFIRPDIEKRQPKLL